MSSSEDPRPLSAKFEGSFAYITVKDRLPIILAKVVDHLSRKRAEITKIYGEQGHEESKDVIGRISKLRNEMQTNKPLIPITDDFADVGFWNKCLEEYIKAFKAEPKWFEASWLYVECYTYRRLYEAFQLTNLLREFDPFRQQKDEALTSSMDAVLILADHLKNISNSLKHNTSENTLRELFIQFVEICLWGNKCDLSISEGRDNSQKDSPISQAEILRPFVLCNDSQQLWEIMLNLKKDKGGGFRLDIVLDNAGFEFVTDLCLIDYLHEILFLKEVHFYVKAMPWFISDVMIHDLYSTVETLSSSPKESIKSFGQRCSGRLKSGAWVVERELYWTLPYDYSAMKTLDKDLYNKLSKSDIILFKGDLNYRKLVGDLDWEYTVPFKRALRGFCPSNLCVMRTIKADTLAGLAPGKAEAAKKKSEKWLVTGEFAVIQCLKV